MYGQSLGLSTAFDILLFLFIGVCILIRGGSK